MPLSQIKANSIDATSSIATTNVTATRIAVGGATANSSYGIFNRYFGNSEIATQYGTGNISGVGAYATEGGVFFDNGTTKTYPVKWQGDGYVTLPYQPVFAGYGGGTQSWSGSSAYQILQIGYQNTNIPSAKRSGYNTSTYRFTAPIAGTYFFYSSLTITGNASGPESFFVVNGSGFTWGAIGYLYTAGYNTMSSHTVMYLNASDYVDVRVINNNNVSFTVDLGRANFGGYFLG